MTARSGDRGSGSIYVLLAAGLVMALGLAAASIGDAVVARHRADSMADLAALAGAEVAVRGGDGCAAARAYVRRDDGQVIACAASPSPAAVVTVRVRLPTGRLLARFGLGTVTSAARAGPASGS